MFSKRGATELAGEITESTHAASGREEKGGAVRRCEEVDLERWMSCLVTRQHCQPREARESCRRCERQEPLHIERRVLDRREHRVGLEESFPERVSSEDAHRGRACSVDKDAQRPVAPTSAPPEAHRTTRILGTGGAHHPDLEVLGADRPLDGHQRLERCDMRDALECSRCEAEVELAVDPACDLIVPVAFAVQHDRCVERGQTLLARPRRRALDAHTCTSQWSTQRV